MVDAAASLNPMDGARVGAHANLSTVRLISLSCGMKNTEPVLGSLSTLSELGLAMQRGDTGVGFALKLDARTTAAENEDQVVFALEAVLELTYSLEDPAEYSEDELAAFGATSAAFAAWPYMRELMQTMTQRCGLAPIVLDVMRMPVTDQQEVPSPE